MESSAFFTTEPDDGWGGTRTVLNTGLIDAIAKEPIDLADDLDVAQALSRLVHDELRRYGTDSTNALSDIQIAGAIRALKSVLRRLGIDFALTPPSMSTACKAQTAPSNGRCTSLPTTASHSRATRPASSLR